MADKTKAVPPSLLAWAKAEKPPRLGVTCWLCKHPDIADEVHEAAELIRTEKVQISWRQLFKKVVELHDYPRGESAFVNHCRNHGTKWREE